MRPVTGSRISGDWRGVRLHRIEGRIVEQATGASTYGDDLIVEMISRASRFESSCWCGRGRVWVTREDIRHGRTMACSYRRCPGYEQERAS